VAAAIVVMSKERILFMSLSVFGFLFGVIAYDCILYSDGTQYMMYCVPPSFQVYFFLFPFTVTTPCPMPVPEPVPAPLPIVTPLPMPLLFAGFAPLPIVTPLPTDTPCPMPVV